MKLPKNARIYLVPGSVLSGEGHLYIEDDRRLRADFRLSVEAPKIATSEEEVSEALEKQVEPVELFETFRRRMEIAEDEHNALLSRQVTSDGAVAWLNQNPGVFTPWTMMRDYFQWSNRYAWEQLFYGDIPLYMPTPMRREKREAWAKLSAAERKRLEAEWMKRRKENQARYDAYKTALDDAILRFEQDLVDAPRVRIEEVRSDDPNLPAKVSEPWLSLQQKVHRTLALDMDVLEARVQARLQAAKRGKEARDRDKALED